MQCIKEFRNICAMLMKELKEKGPPQDDDVSIGAQLLRARCSATGGLGGHALISTSAVQWAMSA